MKRMDLSGARGPNGELTALYVIRHAKQQRRRGKNPSLAYKGVRNPRLALKLAWQEVVSEHIMVIPNCAVMVKSPEAMDLFLADLRNKGYEDKTYVEKGEKRRPNYFYMSLRDDVLVDKGVCNSCNSYISRNGIKMHKHKCEVCGEFTYLEFVDGTTVRFYWQDDIGSSAFEPSMKMKVKDYDDENRCLILYAKPMDGNNFNDWNLKNALKSLRKHRPSYSFVKIEGKTYISIPYEVHYGKRTGPQLINMADSHGHVVNHRMVKLFQGKEYGEWFDPIPIPENYTVKGAWEGYPLPRSPYLHETIIHAAGMVSRCDYYYQDGRTEFREIHLLRMRLFVEHFTDINIDEWDRMIERADKSGPGMIRALAAFCHPDAVPKNEPNFWNLVHGVSKIQDALNGHPVKMSDDEIAAMWDAGKVPENQELLHHLMQRPTSP